LAVATATTLQLPDALATMTVLWIAHQTLGFSALGYAWTRQTVL
jgi:hypothetical protein